MLNLSTLRGELVNLIKTKAISNTRRDLWLNQAQEDIAAELDCEHLNTTLTFTSVANQRSYYVGLDFNKVLSLRDMTNDIDLTELTEGELEDLDPDFSDTGTPYYYSITGMSWVENQPSSASVLTIVSSEAADTTQKVRVSGLNSNGVEITEQISLNGVTSVPGTTSFSSIRQIAKDSTTTGIVTVSSNSGAVIVCRISPFLLTKQYQPINLYTIPDAANTYQVRGIRKPKPLVNSDDYPDFPEAYHELVLIGAAIRGHIDRFRPAMADQLRKTMWYPLVQRFRGEVGNKRGKMSPVIAGEPSIHFGGRLPSNYPLED